MHGAQFPGTTETIRGCTAFIHGSNLGLDVVERRGIDDGETYEKNVGLWVGKRAESIVVFLASSVPETQTDRPPINHYTGGIVVKAAILC